VAIWLFLVVTIAEKGLSRLDLELREKVVKLFLRLFFGAHLQWSGAKTAVGVPFGRLGGPVLAIEHHHIIRWHRYLFLLVGMPKGRIFDSNMADGEGLDCNQHLLLGYRLL
jgi:hypothetical protein